MLGNAEAWVWGKEVYKFGFVQKQPHILTNVNLSSSGGDKIMRKLYKINKTTYKTQ